MIKFNTPPDDKSKGDEYIDEYGNKFQWCDEMKQYFMVEFNRQLLTNWVDAEFCVQLGKTMKGLNISNPLTHKPILTLEQLMEECQR